MKTPVNNLYTSTKPLLDIFLKMNLPPKIAIRLPELFDTVTGLPADSRRPAYDTDTTCFCTKDKKVYANDIFPFPEEYIYMGKITSDSDQIINVDGVWWLLCETELKGEWPLLRRFEEYLRFDSIDFVHTLYAEFIPMNGFIKRYDWSGILIKRWSEVDKDITVAVSTPAIIKLPLLQSLVRFMVKVKSYVTVLLWWGRNPVYYFTFKAKKASFRKSLSLYKLDTSNTASLSKNIS